MIIIKRVLPKVGQSLALLHHTVVGELRTIHLNRVKVVPITKVYRGGHVGTASGDVWNISKGEFAKKFNADFETVS